MAYKSISESLFPVYVKLEQVKKIVNVIYRIFKVDTIMLYCCVSYRKVKQDILVVYFYTEKKSVQKKSAVNEQFSQASWDTKS